MAIVHQCPTCFEVVSLPDTSAGQKARCGVCLTPFEVPGDVPVAEVVDAEPVPQKAEPVKPPRSSKAPPQRASEEPRDGKSPRRTRATDREKREPRRRRWAEPVAPPKVRGTGFWVMVTLAPALLLLVAAAGMYFVFAPQWREHESAAGGYKVEFPAAPRNDLVGLIANPPPAATFEGTVLRMWREEFLVSYADIPPDQRVRMDDEALLARGVADLKRIRPGADVLDHRTPDVSGFPGRELVLRSPDGGVIVARVVLADTRRYIVQAGGPDSSAESPRVRRFLDSFAVTDPAFHAAAKERKENARKAAEAVVAAREEAERQKAAELAARKEREERARLAKQEADRIEAERRQAAAEARAREHQAVLQKSRDEFRARGPNAPDPYLIPGLVLHLGFDGPEPMWPKGAGKLVVPPGAVPGPGPRGSALYMTGDSRVTLREPAEWVKAGLKESVTVAGWVKLRYRPVTLVQFEFADGHVGAHLTADGNQIVWNTGAARNALTEGNVGVSGSRVPAPAPHDDRWHHVAAVREYGGLSHRAVIYLDGRPVREATVPVKDWGGVDQLTLAQAVDIAVKTWTAPTGPPDLEGKPGPMPPDEIACAVDEICVYNRALTLAEVRLLAGVDPPSADIAQKERPDPINPKAPAVTVTPAEPLPGLSGIAFDPGRKTAWAVTDARPAELLRLSYPDLKPLARYPLSGPAGPIAFDPVENRLFVVVGADDAKKRPPPPEPGGWPATAGDVYRYDLGDLPPAGPVTAITPAGKVRGQATGGDKAKPITALAVSNDGDWLFVIYKWETSGTARAGLLYRVAAHLQSPDELLSASAIGGAPAFPYRLAVMPDGGIAYPNGGIGRGSNWTVMTPVTGTLKGGRVYNVGGWGDWAVHPTGDRVYQATDWGGVDETPPLNSITATTPVRPIIRAVTERPPGIAVNVGISSDGRFLFQSVARPRDADSTLTVVDTTIVTAPTVGPPPSGVLKGGRGQYGSPFWLSPDGSVVVFRSGQVVRVSYPAGLAPTPRPPAPRVARLAVAPMPRWIPIGIPHEGRVPPAASEFPGLKFYLAFDEPAEGGVREEVTKKAVGKLTGGEYVEGVRGKALRLSCDPNSTMLPGVLDLSDRKEVFRVPDDEPFTLALWFRPVAGWVTPLEATGPAGRIPDNRLFVGTGVVGDLSGAGVSLSRYEAKQSTTHRWLGAGRGPSQWRHLAVVRDANRNVRVLIDGIEVLRKEGTGQVSGPLDFETLRSYVSPNLGVAVLDLDELCLFGQALTDDQVRRLAGLPEGDAPPRAAVAKGSGLHLYAGEPVPPASELKGLTFYLPCTTLASGKTPEAVSSTDLPVVAGTELVDGVRGKALRFTPKEDRDRLVAGMGYGMDVSDSTALNAAAGKPFTLATWARMVNVGRYNNTVVDARGGTGRVPTRSFALSVGKERVELRLQSEAAGPNGSLLIAGKAPEPGRWFHLAVTRDPRGRVRLLIDGVAVEAKKESTFTSGLRYDRVWLAGGPAGPPSMDLAEFSFYDRLLTDAEIKRLAAK
jgi:hypothetical protein